MDIAQEKQLIENRISDLRRQRGLALLHGKKWNDDEIIAEQNRLEALQDVDAAQVEQARDEQGKQHSAQVNSIRQELADLSVASNKALTEAETALRAAVKAQRLHHQHEAAKRKAIGRLNQLTGS